MNAVYTARQMRNADNYCEQKLNIPTLTLMSKAAFAMMKVCARTVAVPAKVLFLCGKGNNAGDGFAAARLMKEMGYEVTVALLCGKEFSPDAAVMFRTVPSGTVKEEEEDILAAVEEAELVVDCVYGTGFRGKLPKNVRRIFNAARSKTVIACDLPSGVGSDDGSVCEGALCATKTVTFAAYKPCFFLYPAKDYCGAVIPADIGMPKEALEKQNGIGLPDREYIHSLIRPRPENSHKGTFGSLLTVCGSQTMTGAAALAAQGALRCGVGLVTMALPKQIIPTLQAKLSEPVFTQRKGSPKATAVLVGCGIGNDPKALKFALEQGKSTVIDADAINLLAEDSELLQNFLDKYPKAQVILTPHPAEFARFMKTSVQKMEADRLAAARKFAEQYPTVTLVLKGHHTIVAHGESFFMNLTGNTGLSKGGSGDVLAGMIASFLAQGYSATEAALCGVYLHGAAANELRKELSEHGMLPSDLPLAVARLLKEFETIA